MPTSTWPAALDTGIPTEAPGGVITSSDLNWLWSIAQTLEQGGEGVQSIAYAATITPDCTKGSFVLVGLLTGNMTINAPANPTAGRRLKFLLKQDSGGAHAVTLNAVFPSGIGIQTTANSVTAFEIVYDGAAWRLFAVNPPTSANGLSIGKGGMLYDIREYGAKIDGTGTSTGTDDSAAVQACLNDAIPGARILIPNRNGKFCKTTVPLTLPVDGLTFVGDGGGSNSTNCSLIKNASSDLFTVTGTRSGIRFDGVALWSAPGGGHIFAAATANVSYWAWDRVTFIQENDAKSIWNCTAGCFVFCRLSRWFSQHTLTATVPTWNLISNNTGNISANSFERGVSTYSGNFVFWVEEQTSGTYAYKNAWRDISWEVCNGGYVKQLSSLGGLVDNCGAYDSGTTTQHGYVIDKSAAGSNPVGNTFRKATRAGGALGGGLRDIWVANTTGWPVTKIEECNGAIDLNGGKTLLEGMQGAGNPNYTLFNGTGVTQIDASQVLTPAGTGMVAIHTKAGAPADGDFWFVPPDGTIAVDTTGNFLYVRIGGTWKKVAVA